MNIAHINLSKMSYFDTTISHALESACKEKKRKCPLLVELPGPNIRVEKLLGNKPVTLKKGEMVYITTNRYLESAEVLIYCGCESVPGAVKEGTKILIDKGKVSLTVKSVQPERVFNFFRYSSEGVAVAQLYYCIDRNQGEGYEYVAKRSKTAGKRIHQSRETGFANRENPISTCPQIHDAY